MHVSGRILIGAEPSECKRRKQQRGLVRRGVVGGGVQETAVEDQHFSFPWEKKGCPTCIVKPPPPLCDVVVHFMHLCACECVQKHLCGVYQSMHGCVRV